MHRVHTSIQLVQIITYNIYNTNNAYNTYIHTFKTNRYI